MSRDDQNLLKASAMNDFYAGFSPEVLDQEYRVIDTVPDPATTMALAIKMSDELKTKASCIKNVSYGENERQTLDLFLCDQENRPSLIFIHGGYWYQFSKDEFSFVAEQLVELGINVIIPSYSLCPSVGVDEIFSELKELITWSHRELGIYTHAQDIQLTVCGHSAGGHLAAMLATVDWQKEYGIDNSILQCVVTLSGVFDLTPLPHTFLQENLQLTQHCVDSLSPMFLPPHPNVELIAGVGSKETSEFIRQTREYVDHWQKSGNTATTVCLDDHDHLSLLWELVRPNSGLLEAILRKTQNPQRSDLVIGS